MARARMLWRAANRSGWLQYVVLGMIPAVALVAAPGCQTPPRAAGGAAAASRAGPTAPRARASEVRPRAMSYLQDDYERIFPERVRLAHYGAVRYAARDGGDAGGEGERSDAVAMGDAMTLVVVDQWRDRVRIIAPQDHYRMLLWLEERDFYTVVTELSALSPDGHGAPARGAAAPAGIRLLPGLAVQIENETSGRAHIRHRDDCVSFTGTLPRSALGTQFVPIESVEREVDGAVAAGTAIVDRPGGRPLARFVSECDVAVTGPERDGHRPILYATEWFEVRGWVPTTSGKAGSGNGRGSSWGYGYGHLGLWGTRSRHYLPEGTCLFARRGGPAIGMVVDEVNAPLAPPVNGWWQLPLETVWGDLNVWVAQDPGGPPEDAERQREQRRLAQLSARADASDSEASADDGDSTGDEEKQLPALRRCR